MVDIAEHALVFGRHHHLLGIVTEPRQAVPALPALVLLNAGIIHRVGPSRLAVETARGLARLGYRVLRFDLSGLGDSGPSSDGTLQEVVQRDIRDAVDAAARGRDPVVLVGLCSGADNAFFVAPQDARVRGLVLIDPTVHRTSGFLRRRIRQRVRSPSFWWNVVSGRFLWNRLRARAPGRPPGYYGLLVCNAREARQRASALTRRGVRFLYVLTSGVTDYCNSPAQVQESMPGSFNGNLRTEWRMQADHVMSRADDRRWLLETISQWLQSGPWQTEPEPGDTALPSSSEVARDT